MSVREILLILNAEDRVTRPLKKVAADLNRMGSAADKAAKRQQLLARRQGMIDKARGMEAARQLRLQKDIQAIGEKAVRIEEMRAARLRQISDTHRAIEKTGTSILRNDHQRLAIEERMVNLDKERKRLQAQVRRSDARPRARQMPTAVRAGKVARAADITTTDLPKQRRLMEINARAASTLNSTLDAQEKSVGRLHRAYERLGRRLNLLPNEEAAARSAYDRSGNAINRQMQGVVDLDNHMEKLDRTTGSFTKTKLGPMSDAMGHVGRTMGFVGAAGVFGFGLAANAAADFDTKINLAATQTDNFSKAADVGFQAVIDQMTKFPASGDEMTATLYDIWSSTNATIPQGTKLLETFNKAAVAGQTDLQTAARGTMAIMNAFKIPLTSAGKVLNVVFKGVRYGTFTMDEFNKSIGNVIPAAANLDQNITEVTTAMAFLTRQGLTARMSATSLARAYDLMARPKMVQNLEKAGIVIRDTNGDFLDMHEIVGNMIHRFPQLAKGGVAVSKFIKSMSGTEATAQARRFFQNAFRNYKLYTQLQDKMRKKNDQFGASYRKMAETSGVKWKTFMNTLKAMAIVIGTEVIPIFMELAKPLISLLHWFNGLSDGTKSLITKIVFFGTIAVGIIGVILMIAGAIGGLVAGLAIAEVSLATVGAAFLIVIGVIAALAAIAYLVYKNWDKIGPVFWAVAHAAQDAFNWILEKAQAVYDWFVSVWPTIKEIAGSVWDWVRDKAVAAWNAIMSVVGPVIEFIKQKFNEIKDSWNRNSTDIMHAFNNILGAARAVFNAIKAVVSTVMPYIRTVFNALRPYFVGVLQGVIGTFRVAWTVISAVIRAAWGVIKAVISGAIATVSAILALGMHLINGQWGKAWGDLKDLAKAQLDTLKGVITSALSGAAGLLYDAGVAVIQGLIDGMGSMFGALKDKAGEAVSFVTDLWPNSPQAKYGPLAQHPPAVMGARVSADLAAGMMKKAHLVGEASAHMAGMVTAGGAGYGGGGWQGKKRAAYAGAGGVNYREGDIIVHAYQEEGIERKLERAQFRQRKAREMRR